MKPSENLGESFLRVMESLPHQYLFIAEVGAWYRCRDAVWEPCNKDEVLRDIWNQLEAKIRGGGVRTQGIKLGDLQYQNRIIRRIKQELTRDLSVFNQNEGSVVLAGRIFPDLLNNPDRNFNAVEERYIQRSSKVQYNPLATSDLFDDLMTMVFPEESIRTFILSLMFHAFIGKRQKKLIVIDRRNLGLEFNIMDIFASVFGGYAQNVQIANLIKPSDRVLFQYDQQLLATYGARLLSDTDNVAIRCLDERRLQSYLKRETFAVCTREKEVPCEIKQTATHVLELHYPINFTHNIATNYAVIIPTEPIRHRRLFELQDFFPEREGILNAMMKAARRLPFTSLEREAAGFAKINRVYLSDVNFEEEYLSTYCEFNPLLSTYTDTIFLDYVIAAKERRLDPIGKTSFTHLLTNDNERPVRAKSEGKYRVYIGIGLARIPIANKLQNNEDIRQKFESSFPVITNSMNRANEVIIEARTTLSRQEFAAISLAKTLRKLEQIFCEIGMAVQPLDAIRDGEEIIELSHIDSRLLRYGLDVLDNSRNHLQELKEGLSKVLAVRNIRRCHIALALAEVTLAQARNAWYERYRNTYFSQLETYNP